MNYHTCYRTVTRYSAIISLQTITVSGFIDLWGRLISKGPSWVIILQLHLHGTFEKPDFWPLTPFSASLPPRRMLINSTGATWRSSRPWHRRTPCPSPATSGEAPPPDGTRPVLTGLEALKREPCSRAGRAHQTTAPSPRCSDFPTAQSRAEPAAGPGLRLQSDLFFPRVPFFFVLTHYRVTAVTKTCR